MPPVVSLAEFRANEVSQEPAMSDTHRRYRSINRALRQIIAVRPNSHAEKHLNTLSALICGIVGKSAHPVAQDRRAGTRLRRQRGECGAALHPLAGARQRDVRNAL